MKNRPLLIVALASIGVLWFLYRVLGGIEGIRHDPDRAIGVTAIFLVLAVPPIAWFGSCRIPSMPSRSR